MRSRRRFKCLDCGVDTGKIGEFYFLKSVLWGEIVKSRRGMLCIGCAEARLRRQLTPADFTDCMINEPTWGQKSLRLISRLKDEYPS